MGLKTAIIHLLGGYTEAEVSVISRNTDNNLIKHGERLAIVDALVFADCLYGVDAEEWSKKVYEYLKNKLEDVSVRQGRR